MSLLRVRAFATCVTRRSLLDKCAVCCQQCVSIRSGAVRRISGTPLQLQKRNVSLVFPKTGEAKKSVVEQSQLLDVLKARIQQLQTDVVLDVQHAEVQFVKAPSSGRGVSSGRGPTKGSSQEKTDIPKSGAKGASKSQQSRWMEKLTRESKNKLKKQQHLQKPVKEKLETTPVLKTSSGCTEQSDQIKAAVSPTAASTTEKVSKGKLRESKNPHPGKKKQKPTVAQIRAMELAEMEELHRRLGQQVNHRPSSSIPDEGPEAVSEGTATAASTTEKVSKGKLSKSKNPNPAEKKQKPTVAQIRVMELAEIEELHRRLGQQVNQWLPSSIPEEGPEAVSEGTACRDTQLSIIRSYMEVCVFTGDVDRAHRFLLSQHRMRSRRKLLDTGVYNIMMRVLAKKGSLNEIGSLFILLEEAGLDPNLGSYCAALECMGRIPTCSPKFITRCLDHMKQDGLSVDHLFNHCVFRQDERDMVLKAIRVVQPDYQPCLDLASSKQYSSLVQDFYAQRADHNYPKLDFTQDELRERFKRQLSVEQACNVTIASVEAAKPVTKNMAKMREMLTKKRVQWRKILLQALREYKLTLANNTKNYRPNLYPYLCLLEDREYVDLMMQCMAHMPPSGESLKFLASDLGNRVFTKYSVRQKYQNQIVEKLGTIYSCYTDLLAKETKEYDILPREQWCNLEMEHSSGPGLQRGENSWPYIVTLELGTCLVDLMVKNLKINNDALNSAPNSKIIPVLYHMYTFRNTRQIGFIKPHPILTQIQLEAMETELIFDSYVMPMLCPPLPWTSVKFGAYLLTPTKLMRSLDGAIQHEVLLEKCQSLHAVLDSLNQLGNCAWKINKPLLDVIISIFNDRGNDKLGIPPPMSEAPKLPHFKLSEKARMKMEAISAKKKCSEMHSLRMDGLYKLSIANHMRDEVFWFPHNMDFRGRTYPCPPYFNHLGSDVTRAILVFAEGKPLGPKGLDWLKIHLVNLTGLKKRSSLQERLEYANTIMEDILDSADNPMNGKRWWMNADEPWQALACCMEVANADGSCNGLQHYAALGRDVIGATSVNLIPCDLPQDVYSGVAQQVEEFRVRDAGTGRKIARALEGFISRKVVKQTVMTVVYGVTRYGGRLQIEKKLREIEEFPKEYVWDASHYLVQLVFSGLKEMFKGTREIQDWLTESARLISKSGHTVEWVTPLGLPIIQPYHRVRTQLVKSNIQHINLQIYHDDKEKPDTIKQKNAFPPNFIHSLDSTHMMLTALHCYSAGVTFASVHDCFWTHALTVDTMNKVCREQFVVLHSQPILQELSNSLLKKYCTRLPTEAKNMKYLEFRRLMLMLSNVPKTGDFDLQQVKESTYFFS